MKLYAIRYKFKKKKQTRVIVLFERVYSENTPLLVH